MEEDSLHSSAYRLRLLYVVLLSHCEVMDPDALFELHWRRMAEHWLKKYSESQSKLYCKEWIRRRVRANYGNVDIPLFDNMPANIVVPSESVEPQVTLSTAEAKGQ